MANNKNVQPYKNNTLAWMAGNLAAQSRADRQQAWEEWNNVIEPRLQEFWSNFLDAEKDIFIDKPLNTLSTVWGYLLGSPQEAQTGNKMPTRTGDLLRQVRWDMHGKTNPTNQTWATEQPTQTWTTGWTTGGTVTYWWKVGWSTWWSTWGNKQTSSQTVTPLNFASKEDIVYYLASNTPWWNNLTEEQRVAMVENLWNQSSQWDTTSGDQPSNSLPSDYSDTVTQNMQSDLLNTFNDTLYGKISWQSWNASNGIVANQDANSWFAIDANARVAKVQNFLLQNPYTVAASLAAWGWAYSEQLLTDVQKYAPEYWNQVQAQLKKIKVWDTVNAIASWENLPDTSKSSIEWVNKWVDNWAKSVSDTPQQTQYTIQNASNAMANNQVATTASQEIMNIDAQIEEYKSKIGNLEKEANAYFKWDVPQYVVNAYINNKSQKYQAEIDKLEWRRQSAMDLYKIEISNYQWGEEMKYKYQQLKRDLNNDTWDRWYKEQQLNKANIHWENWKAYQVNSDWTVTQLTDATALKSYQTDVQNIINWYKSMYTSWWGTKTATGYKYGVCWLECEWFTDMFTESTTWLRMTWANWRPYTTAQEKIDYINEDPWVVNVWDIAIAAWWVYDSTWGHTMIVTWRDPATQTIELLWSNKDWDKTVYSTTDTLSNLYAKWLRWFWNPYKDMIEASVANGTYWYNDSWILITPMTSKFDAYISQWVDRKSVSSAERIYDTLYEISTNWELEALINSWDFWKMRAYVWKSQFADTKDDEWVTFWNSLNDYKNKYMAKEFTWWEASMNALNKLMRLVEKKLRKESWAVINSWEWRWEFELFLPRPWESADTQWDKLSWWDEYIVELLRNWWLEKKTDYIPLFPKWQKREIF